MTDAHPPAGAEDRSGATTAVGGTAVPVDLTSDKQARWLWVVLLSGPVLWFTHFMVVYLVAEAGCTGDGPGLDRLDPPVPDWVTVGATTLATLLCAGFAWRGFRWWRSHDSDDPAGYLAFTGFLLAAISTVAIVFAGTPVLFLDGC